MTRSVFPNPEKVGLATFSSKKVPPPTVSDESKKTERELQGYLDRVRNYIPSEIVAFLIFVNSLIGANVLDVDGQILVDGWVAIGAMVVGIVACVLFVKSTAQTEGNPVWVLQAMMSIIAFLIWSYAIDAKFLDVIGIETVPSVSGLVLASFTMLSGFLVPNAPKRDGNKSNPERSVQDQPGENTSSSAENSVGA